MAIPLLYIFPIESKSFHCFFYKYNLYLKTNMGIELSCFFFFCYFEKKVHFLIKGFLHLNIPKKGFWKIVFWMLKFFTSYSQDDKLTSIQKKATKNQINIYSTKWSSETLQNIGYHPPLTHFSLRLVHRKTLSLVTSMSKSGNIPDF